MSVKRSFADFWRRASNIAVWENFLFRGDNWFLAFGGIYIRSARKSEAKDARLRAVLPGMSAGAAFVRLSPVRATGNIAVLIENVGRFGNSIAQVLNALEIARNLESKSVLFHRFDAIGNRAIDLGYKIILRKLPIARSRGRSHPHTIWRTSAITPRIVFCEPCDDWFEQPRLALRAATNVGGLIGPDPIENLTLTIHVRGGDVFSDKPEELYGQPPWAFYQRILESKKWNLVILVTEDDENPVVLRIAEWCVLRGTQFKRTGDSFTSAIEAISQGTHLVGGAGTFLGAIVYLAGGRRVLYQFEADSSPLICHKQVSVQIVRDEAGEYVESIMRGNWKNTPVQRDLMVSYPLSKLSGVTGQQQ
jgi:hypothetical protein